MSRTPDGIYYPPPRSTETGHRVGVGGQRLIESRSFPFWLWPFELIDRLHARLMRYAPHKYWTGIVFGGEYEDGLRSDSGTVHKSHMC